MTTQLAKSTTPFIPTSSTKNLHRIVRWFFAAIVALHIAAPLRHQQARAAESFTGLVNLNTATPQELQHLPGVGPSKAKRIVDHRTHKPFRTVAELVRVKGFGAKTMARLRPFLTTSAPTNIGSSSSAGGACACACDPGKTASTTLPAVALPSVVKPPSISAKR
jgi:competence ComEA-like helix-hairpin-helix protein